MEFDTYGKHIIADFHGCNPEIIDSLEYMKATCETAAKLTGAEILDTVYHKFDPVGITILVLLSTSHLSFHSTPQSSYIAFDVFTCTKDCDSEKAYEYMKMILKPTEIHRQVIERGI